MHLTIRFLLVGILLTVIPSAILAQVNPFQGVYAGRLLVRARSRGFQPYFYPSQMTVLPDGRSIIITVQLPNSVATWPIRGSFKGNLFEGVSRGRFNAVNYDWAAKYKIRFFRDEARIEEDVSINTPPGYVQSPQDHVVPIFHRVRS